ncbi:glycosyltransferase [Planococcus halocryophilus]|uniref:glycosyltransferase n=1 Tax=Planococcus halocryophilus TaxID=1215089 RepID=UPI001F0D6F61|nr:glycosyltransferase [Planococcus halocryophilus]MCH4826790.1 glycosyltransferase [Planococcus halocryophilus]
MNYKKYSVLMSVYKKEKPENLRQSLISVYDQTIEPDEVILIKDGPLTEELESIIAVFVKKYTTFNVYALKKNSGLGVALNYGLEYCNNEIVFRMDTDDISLKDRARIQLEYLQKNPNVDILGSYVEEFIGNEGESKYIKKVPLFDNQIKKTFKKKNSMNHPTVVFKKSIVKKVGGYIELKLNEDYYLWIRLVEKGYTFANIDKPLVKMRINDNTYLRRGGLKYFYIQNIIYKYMRDINYISNYEYIKGFFVRIVFRVLLPNKIRKQVYIKLLRREL